MLRAKTMWTSRLFEDGNVDVVKADLQTILDIQRGHRNTLDEKIQLYYRLQRGPSLPPVVAACVASDIDAFTSVVELLES